SVGPSEVRQRANYLDLAFREPVDKPLVAGQQQNRQVATVHHMLASGDRGLDEVAKTGMQLRCSACDVNGMRSRPADCRDYLVDNLVRHHGIEAVGPGVHMTMAAGSICPPPEAHLEG